MARSKEIDSLSLIYDKYLIFVDFICEIHKEPTSNFCQIHDFKNLTNNPIYYKSPENPTRIDLIMTNKPKFYCNSIGVSDFHKMKTTVLKNYFKKQNLKSIVYRKYKSSVNLLFREEFLKDLLNEKSLKGFKDSFLQIVNYLVPLKTKCSFKSNAFHE